MRSPPSHLSRLPCPRLAGWLALGASLALAGCAERRATPSDGALDAGAPDAASDNGAELPEDASQETTPSASAAGSAEVAPAGSTEAPVFRPCPADMVFVAGKVCVDRFEAQLVDARSWVALSPYYPPDGKLALRLAEEWEERRHELGPDEARKVGLPPLPAFQRGKLLPFRATSRKMVTPNGYVSGKAAAAACANAKKRLCTEAEWRTACRGEKDTQFPYGERYEAGTCNVFRDGHPSAELHGDMSIGHLDPRLNRVSVKGKPLLRRTGETKACASRWGADAIYDMVGNLDEWIDDPAGTFVGGFYSRSTREGCSATARAHPFDYQDYSTGVRCCRAPRQPGDNEPDAGPAASASAAPSAPPVGSGTGR